MRRISRIRPTGLASYSFPARQATPFISRPYSTPQKTEQPIAQSSIESPRAAEVQADLANDLQSEIDSVEEEVTTAEWVRERPLLRRPPRRQWAERDGEVVDPTYTPASTMKGLKVYGGLQDWWDQPRNWNVEYQGFQPKGQTTNEKTLKLAVLRASVEAWALRQSGASDEQLLGSWKLPTSDQGPWIEAKFTVAENGTDVTISEEHVAGIVESLIVSEKDDPKELEALSKEKRRILKSSSLHLEVGDVSKAPLTDNTMKFAVAKRVFQLTGTLVPDSKLSMINTAADMCQVMEKPPKPRLLVEQVKRKGGAPALTHMPNVKLHHKKQTRGDRDKSLGRYKLIEEEFRKRQLPVHGHAFAPKNKEIKYLRGGA